MEINSHSLFSKWFSEVSAKHLLESVVILLMQSGNDLIRLLLFLLDASVQSGKLVMKMFQKIFELVADENALVCVLIDEVCT